MGVGPDLRKAIYKQTKEIAVVMGELPCSIEELYRTEASESGKLQNENAKLRELVLDLYCLAYPNTVEWKVSDATYDKYSPCEKCHELHGGESPCASTAEDMTEEWCTPIQANVVADRMRELGVKVN